MDNEIRILLIVILLFVFIFFLASLIWKWAKNPYSERKVYDFTLLILIVPWVVGIIIFLVVNGE